MSKAGRPRMMGPQTKRTWQAEECRKRKLEEAARGGDEDAIRFKKSFERNFELLQDVVKQLYDDQIRDRHLIEQQNAEIEVLRNRVTQLERSQERPSLEVPQQQWEFSQPAVDTSQPHFSYEVYQEPFYQQTSADDDSDRMIPSNVVPPPYIPQQSVVCHPFQPSMGELPATQYLYRNQLSTNNPNNFNA